MMEKKEKRKEKDLRGSKAIDCLVSGFTCRCCWIYHDLYNKDIYSVLLVLNIVFP